MKKIGYETLDINTVMEYIDQRPAIELDDRAVEKIEDSHNFLKKKISAPDSIHYGINTGFGNMCDRQISPKDLLQLQLNLVRSHAAGSGARIPDEITRIIILLKVQALSRGYSGVRVELVEQLLWLYNSDVLPVIYEQGSLGASGDLAPLSHMALSLIGEGDVIYKGEIRPSAHVLRYLGRRPIVLEAKEGIALINGTQFCTAYALWSTYHAERLFNWANRCLALSCEAFDCDLRIFSPQLHAVRGQVGQETCAVELNKLLADSELCTPLNQYVQDPYSFRCAPQVHGASLDAIHHARTIVNREINAVSDNPILFPEIDDIISGGNFHAQPLALILDFLKIAVSELGSISERRGYKLLRGQRDLPINLTDNPGLESGLMILQYTAASIVSQNKQLSTPASVDSIVSSAGQEDHVSMGANAATACARVIDNVYRVLAIEWVIGTRAINYRDQLNSSSALQKLCADYKKHHSIPQEDHVLRDDIVNTVIWLKAYDK